MILLFCFAMAVCAGAFGDIDEGKDLYVMTSLRFRPFKAFKNIEIQTPAWNSTSNTQDPREVIVFCSSVNGKCEMQKSMYFNTDLVHFVATNPDGTKLDVSFDIDCNDKEGERSDNRFQLYYQCSKRSDVEVETSGSHNHAVFNGLSVFMALLLLSLY